MEISAGRVIHIHVLSLFPLSAMSKVRHTNAMKRSVSLTQGTMAAIAVYADEEPDAQSLVMLRPMSGDSADAAVASQRAVKNHTIRGLSIQMARTGRKKSS